jgi:hypothetical protein
VTVLEAVAAPPHDQPVGWASDLEGLAAGSVLEFEAEATEFLVLNGDLGGDRTHVGYPNESPHGGRD